MSCHSNLFLPICCMFILFMFASAKLSPKLIGNWNRVRDYPLPVFESAGGIIDGPDGTKELIIAGGYVSGTGIRPTKATYSLTLGSSSTKWKKLSDLPVAVTHCSQVLSGSELFLCGGFLGKAPGRSINNCYVYKRLEDKWYTLPSLPEARGGGGLVLLPNGKLFYSSGMSRKQGYWGGIDIGTSYLLDLKNSKKGWIRKRNIGNARNHMAAVETRGHFYYLGGQHSSNERTGNQDTVQEYDYKSDRWYKKSSIPNAVGHIAASSIKYWNGIIVVAGIENGRKLSNKIWYYDSIHDDWHFVGKFPRYIQSPVCGRLGQLLICATGEGSPYDANRVYQIRLTPPVVV